MRREEAMKVYLGSLGCKLNQSEMDSLAGELAADGHELVASAVEADLCVLNTCAVTHVAAQKSRQALRRLHRDNPQARLIATGCYAQIAPEDLCGLPGLERVLGNHEKHRLVELIGVCAAERQIAGTAPRVSRLRTRALIKIQDGCDNACTYCIIHVARGPQRSRPADEILAEARVRLAAGHKEIVLTGVHIGAYGHDRLRAPDETDLWALVDRILTETEVPRLRLSSIEPWDLSDRAFRLWDDPRLCRHLHLPLQSGCDATLRRMSRRYTTGEFSSWVSTARAAVPDLAVTTDVIAGFPGETDAEFAESLAFVENMGFSRVHVFPYSVRTGTPAALMSGRVPAQIKAQRAHALREVASASQRAFSQRFIGRTLDVLWESQRKSGNDTVWSGLTDNYLRVTTRTLAKLTNTLVPTRLVALSGHDLQGEI
jgi:threonylcarbamoyladenosine tRNA methylthiotransferase MtaB